MGSASRGQLRPHFAGRSPPFLVAALCIGICVLGVSYYTLSTQSSSIETKLALSVQKNQEITSELETCRSQLRAKERDFDQVKTDMEQVKKLLQVSQDNLLTKDKEVDELKSQTAVQKADLEQCRSSESKLRTESKAVEDVNLQWKQKEDQWRDEKKSLEAEAIKIREQVKKKSATDEVSNNADEEKSPGIKVGADAATAAESVNAVVPAAAAAPVVDSGGAAPLPKAKDEIGSETR